ncbi:twin-arginine translocation signal domain-containing protein, partial [Enterococcus faecium]|uniref:twin-arginine translocation signal domain-containing protein n=1 Tax=Enterococcus faecium TaxID=1352 RepID=UPI003F522C91
MNITRRTFTAALSLAGAAAALGLSPWQLVSPANAQTAAEINQAGELGDMALGSKDAPVT